MKAAIGIGVAVALGAIGAAAAAGLATGPAPVEVVTAAPVRPVHNWTGPYLGISAGYGFGAASYVFNTDGDYNNAPGDTLRQPVRGATALGAIAGFNVQRGRGVYGLEATFGESFAGVANDIAGIAPGSTYRIRLHYGGTVSIRAGYAQDRLLAYGSVGVAYAHVLTAVFDANDRVGADRILPGIALGGGLEFAVRDDLWLGVGFQHTRLRAFDIAGEALTTLGDLPAGVFTDHNVTLRQNAVFARLTVKLY